MYFFLSKEYLLFVYIGICTYKTKRIIYSLFFFVCFSGLNEGCTETVRSRI